MVEVAIVRVSPRGEWDLSVEEEEGVERREVIDDGEQRIRANQQEKKYAAASASIMASSAHALTEDEILAAVVDEVEDMGEKCQEDQSDSDHESIENDGAAADSFFGTMSNGSPSKAGGKTKAKAASAKSSSARAATAKSTSKPAGTAPAPSVAAPKPVHTKKAIDFVFTLVVIDTIMVLQRTFQTIVRIITVGMYSFASSLSASTAPALSSSSSQVSSYS